jgi:hypothetical protein
LRNAVAQLQLDAANAGSGFYPGPSVPMSPIGVIVTNTDTGNTDCYNATNQTYGSTCFDKLSVLWFTGVAPAHPASTQSTTSTSMLLTPPGALTASAYAALLPQGTQVLFMKNDGSQVASVVLTQASSTSGSQVKIQFNATDSNGRNTSTNDPLGIFLSSYTYTSGKSLTTGTSFGSNDWVFAITSITYYVDATNSSNPKLMRQASGGTTDELAEQVIGFQVGAGTATPLCVSGSNTTDVPYSFNPANYCYNWTNIQSVRVSIVGRTNPSQPIPNFQNSFDQGPYKIEALTVIVSPRNLSLN